MNRKRLFLLIGAFLGVILLIWIILMLVGGDKTPEPTTSSTPSGSALTRKSSGEKFGPRSRAQTTANVDVGLRTISGSPSPVASGAPKGQALAQAPEMEGTAARSTATPRATTAPRPALPAAPPQFAPLPVPITGGKKEVIVVYSKGEAGNRKIYTRALERDKDDQLVTSPYDDFGVSLSTAAQRVAYYSNEEGASDATTNRTKLKIAELSTGKSTTVAVALPGIHPAAWSPDGRMLAIPTSSSIFLTNTLTGSSLQVPTGNDPGEITWSPNGLQIFFTSEGTQGNTDVFSADTITAAAQAVTTTSDNEHLPATSQDGTNLTFMRSQSGGANDAAVIKNLASGEERTVTASQAASSYVWNLKLTDLVFVSTADKQLRRLHDQKVEDLGELKNPIVVSWDRDYEHVFVIADDGEVKSLYSVEIATGKSELVKGSLADAPDPLTR